MDKYKEVLENLVRKYNNGIWDEDLMQEAYLAAWKCLKTTAETDENKLLSYIITCVKSRLIDIKRKKTVPTVQLSEGFDIEDLSDYSLALIDLQASLDDTDNKILNYLLDGHNAEDIAEMMNVSKRTVYRHIADIKSLLKS